jgi:23S rRNA pseudouridine1911/1915/1917 synthase
MTLAWTTWYKPAGLPVFPPHDRPGAPCVLADLLAAAPDRAAIAWPAGFEGGICHRLDTGTSGALLLAADLDALVEARRQFAEKLLSKNYLLLVSRDPPWDENRCDRPIAHDPRRRSRMVVARGPSTPHRGRWYPAETRFHRVVGRVFAAEMQTGVMHQIRVHAAFLGIPLAGDTRYGGGPGDFCLHHVGLSGERGLATAPVPPPSWV